MSDFPPGQSKEQVQQETIGVIEARVNSLGVTFPIITPVGDDQISVQLAGINAGSGAGADRDHGPAGADHLGARQERHGRALPGYKPEIQTRFKSSDQSSRATAALNSSGSGWEVNLQFNEAGGNASGRVSQAAYAAGQSRERRPRRRTSRSGST